MYAELNCTVCKKDLTSLTVTGGGQFLMMAVLESGLMPSLLKIILNHLTLVLPRWQFCRFPKCEPCLLEPLQNSTESPVALFSDTVHEHVVLDLQDTLKRRYSSCALMQCHYRAKYGRNPQTG